MMRPLFNIATLKDDIEAGSLILTSNNRLASKIRQAWGLYQRDDGKTCWPQPEIHAIEHWIHEQWLCCCDSGAQHAAAGAIVSPVQEQLLWEETIEEDTEKPEMLLPTSFSTLSRNSYNIIQRWQIPVTELQQASPLLYRWIQSFRHKLKQHRLITSADSAAAVLNHYLNGDENNDVGPPPAIITVGFDTIPPLYQAILASAGRQVIEHKTCVSDANQQRSSITGHVRFYDEQQELMAAAAWAADRQRQNPGHRIGIIIPELSRIRGQVERIFRQQLEPEYSLPDQYRTAPPFNISAGIPLSKTPMIASALLLLSLNRPHLSLEQLCRLLNSPFWGEQNSDHDAQVRALTEKRLRNLARHQLSCNEFRHQLFLAEQSIGQPASEAAESSTLSQALQQMESLRRECHNKAPIQQWLSLFHHQLDTINWPGQRSLDSIEYQQYQHWLQVLEQYQALGQLQREIPLSESLRQLRQLTDHSVFQAETADAPIQILGLLESSSLRFDYLWVTGMDNHSWPPAIAPNPLLPISLQQKYKTPRSQPERELQLAQDQIDQFKQAADYVIFSFSEFDASRQRTASTLISDLPPVSPDTLPSPIQLATNQSIISSGAKLEKIDCEYAPPVQLATEESSHTQHHLAENLRGGSSIFRDQASCPFNAFARHRLGALKPPEPLLGLSSMDRGSLLHDCLEQLWQQLTCQQQLLSLSDETLTQIIDQTVTAALHQWQKKRPDLFAPVFTQLEKQRLIQLLDQWLALEKTRPGFRVIAFEKTTETSFGGLPLKLIIDRIDETDSGQKVIIDYKTGKANINSWLGDRPEQPQLPLYMLCSETPVAAVTFAVINVMQQQFIGFSETANLLPNVQPPGKKNEPQNWGELIDQWQHNLTCLAEEFKQGYAAVQLFKPVALQYQQELEPLNRLAELSSINSRRMTDTREMKK